MNWIGKEKKNDVSPEKKVNRAKFILVILGFMALVVILHPSNKEKDGNAVSETELAMEASVDSLIRSLGFEDYDIYHRGPIETLYQQLDCPEEDEIIRLELRCDLVESSPGMTDKQKIQEIEKIMASIDQLKEQVERFYANPKTQMEYQSRRIRFVTPDGKKYTFFQQMMQGHQRTKYFKKMSDQYDNPQNALEKIQNQETE